MGYGQATINDLHELVKVLDRGGLVLVSGVRYPDDPVADELARNIPTIHDMGTGEWGTFRVDHVGMGVMVGKDQSGNKIVFSAGGAMSSLENVSYTTLSCKGPDKGSYHVFPYNAKVVRWTITKLIAHLESVS